MATESPSPAGRCGGVRVQPEGLGRHHDPPDQNARPRMVPGHEMPGEVMVFAATPASVTAARVWLGQQLQGSASGPEAGPEAGPMVDASTCELAQLLVSELATNAVRHTGSSVFEVHLRLGAVLEVAVQDGDPTGAVRVQHAGPGDTGGRGLMIVDVVAHAWGTRQVPGGKAVWFQLPLPGPHP